MIKILIRGGSISAGCGVAKSYVDMVRDNLAGYEVEIINSSKKGDTTFDGCWEFYSNIDPYKPDILMLHFGLDDVYLPVYRSEFKENLVQIVRLARKRFNPLIFLLTSHPFDHQYDMDSINIYYRTIREVCVDLACEMIPVHTYFRGLLHEKGLSMEDFLTADDRLPNERGHAVFAEIVTQRLLHTLEHT